MHTKTCMHAHIYVCIDTATTLIHTFCLGKMFSVIMALCLQRSGQLVLKHAVSLLKFTHTAFFLYKNSPLLKIQPTKHNNLPHHNLPCIRIFCCATYWERFSSERYSQCCGGAQQHLFYQWTPGTSICLESTICYSLQCVSRGLSQPSLHFDL